jgi:uncharacterized membrane protein
MAHPGKRRKGRFMAYYLTSVTDNTLSAVIVFSLLLLMAKIVTPKGRRACLAYGIAGGAAAALVYAALKRHTGFAVRELYDLGVVLPSLVLLAILPAVLRRPFIRGTEAGAAARGAISLLLAAVTAGALPSLLLYPFDFAVGMESVFTTEALDNAAGYSLGLLLMLALGLGVHRIAGNLPRAFLLALFCAVLLVFFAEQCLEAARILVARNMAPRRPWLLSLVIFMLNNANVFSFALLGLTALLSGAPALRARFEPVRAGNPAVRRKQRAEHRRIYLHCACIFLCLLCCGLNITFVRAWANREEALSPPEITAAVDGKILLPIERINDGNLHRFQYTGAGGAAVRYIVVKKSESAYGVGLDACDICGPTGYYQRKDQVICKLCDVVMNKSTIGFPGGCNPVPLRFSISRGSLVIEAADLEAETQRFQ